MYRINRVIHWLFLSGALGIISLGSAFSKAEEVRLNKKLTPDETLCLRQLFQQHYVHYPPPDEIRKLLAETTAGRANLKDKGPRQYIFLIEDPGYCGTAGCWMLIGERRGGGKCRLLDGGNGDGDSVTVLDRRDHGYRRVLTPCEIYFDGKLYQQVHEECPNANVHR